MIRFYIWVGYVDELCSGIANGRVLNLELYIHIKDRSYLFCIYLQIFFVRKFSSLFRIGGGINPEPIL